VSPRLVEEAEVEARSSASRRSAPYVTVSNRPRWTIIPRVHAEALELPQELPAEDVVADDADSPDVRGLEGRHVGDDVGRAAERVVVAPGGLRPEARFGGDLAAPGTQHPVGIETEVSADGDVDRAMLSRMSRTRCEGIGSSCGVALAVPQGVARDPSERRRRDAREPGWEGGLVRMRAG
jgi:hypothetical protein